MAPSRDVTAEIEDRELHAWVEHYLGMRVDGIERRALQRDSSAGEVLTVSTGGRTVELLLKDHRLPQEHDAGSAREVEVYRHVLDAEQLGTPRHLGSLIAEHGRSWLLIEHVGGSSLLDSPFEHWLAAAAWLGRLQGYAAARGIAARPPAFLLRHDLAHLSSVVEEAFRAVASVHAALEQDLRDAIEGYEEGHRRLDDQPCTLVQGSFSPANVLVDQAARPPRVAPLDWQRAALGCAFYDVAALVNGLERQQRMVVLDAHRAAAIELGLRLPDATEARELVAILRQHDLLRSLVRSVRAGAPRRTIERLIALACGLRLDLRSFRHGRSRARSVSGGQAEPLQTEPVLRAWASLGREERVTGVELIRGGPAGGKQRSVYRLRTDGSRLPSAVAKWSRRPALAIERFVYSELLPRLPVPAPAYVGWAEDPDDARWLFVEDVGSLRALREDLTHRTKSSAWLGALHAAGTELARDARVPERGPRWFLESLRESRQTVLSSLANPVFSSGDRRSMRAVAECCGRLESRWDRLEAAFAEQPGTLVHGDFQPKNLYLRPGPDGLTLFPIDWEYASWSVPGLDLGTLLRKGYTTAELEAYAGTSGREASLLPRWISLGCALRAVLAVRWAAVNLPLPFPEVGLRNLPEYCRDLEESFEELDA